MKFHVLMWVMFTLTTYSNSISDETYTLINSTNINITKPGCQSRCGDVIVPYPFGIVGNLSCSLGHGFNIICNTSSDPPIAYIQNTNSGYTSIKNISDSKLRVSSMVAASRCYSNHSLHLRHGLWSSRFNIPPNFTNTPYTFSPENKFTMVGCNGYARFSMPSNVSNSTGCVVFCTNPEKNEVGECSGNGCCQTSLTHDVRYYETYLRTLLDADDAGYRDPVHHECIHAFLAERNVFKFNGSTDLNDTFFPEKVQADVSVVLDWAIGSLSCKEANATHGLACKLNADCVNSTRAAGGYLCMCKKGFEGNPYMPR